jgi:S-methylmethionine-dependent homocysteine/selenocysteine methylase
LAAVLGRHRHGRAVVLYPNSGQAYDALTKTWEAPVALPVGLPSTAADAAADAAGGAWEARAAGAFAAAAVSVWAPAVAGGGAAEAPSSGARGVLCVGGCCQTGTATTMALRSAFEAAYAAEMSKTFSFI